MLGQKMAFLRPPARLTPGLTPNIMVFRLHFPRGVGGSPGPFPTPVAAGGGFPWGQHRPSQMSRPMLSTRSSHAPPPSPKFQPHVPSLAVENHLLQ